MDKASNLILIGMPGSGKSTIGVILAKYLSKDFIDTDLLIQTQHQKSLQQILDMHGYLKLREFEEEVILRLKSENAVIATGGSAVYSSKAMSHLKRQGTIIYLEVPIEELQKRIHNYETRGIASPAGQTLAHIYEERTKLYEEYSGLTICCGEKNHEEVVQDIIEELVEA